MNLALRPSYSHLHEQIAPCSKLTSGYAYPAFVTLKDYLAIKENPLCPAAGWTRRKGENHRSLFQSNGFHHPVLWKPKLDKGWRRLNFEEFCIWYGLKFEE